MSTNSFQTAVALIRPVVMLINSLTVEFAQTIPPSRVSTVVPLHSMLTLYDYLTRLALHTSNRESFLLELQQVKQIVSDTFQKGVRDHGFMFELDILTFSDRLECVAIPISLLVDTLNID